MRVWAALNHTLGREEYFRLRAEDTQPREAACLIGVHIRTAVDWDKGIRKSNSRRTYPDGCVINFKKCETQTIRGNNRVDIGTW
jgi:hypothetical protein